MKRTLMIALLFVGALSLAACGGEEPATDGGSDGGADRNTEATDDTGDTDDTTDAADTPATDDTLVARSYEIGIDGMT